jgi:hypothetical protein
MDIEGATWAYFVQSQADQNQAALPELSPTWERPGQEDIASAPKTPRKLARALGTQGLEDEYGLGIACRTRTALGMLGKSVNAAIRSCDYVSDDHEPERAFRKGRNWSLWPVSVGKSKGSGVKVVGIGAERTAFEVFVKMSYERTLLKALERKMGPATMYGCGGRAWVTPEHYIRARPVGKGLNIAVAKRDDYELLLAVVPGAATTPSWR